jgi:haloalkane dehalogenase
MKNATALALGALMACSPPPPAPHPSHLEKKPMNDPARIDSRSITVLDSTMTFLEAGEGTPIVLLHGNPLSSHVWRHVLPELRGTGRLLAPDLIGMGSSGKPETEYRFRDHARYLDAWMDAMSLADVVLVGHDWGGVLALDWARRHPGRVRGVAVLETILEGLHWRDYPPAGAALFRALRTPGQGEAMVLERNEFLPKSLENGVKGGLSDVDRAAYAAPFPDARSRRPMLQWTRELPIDGEPADVLNVVEENARWVEHSEGTPKLVLTFEGAPLSGSRRIADWKESPPPALRVRALGEAAGHHAPEDAPQAIGEALREWVVTSCQ